MTLNYKASNIARAERELNSNFFTALDDMGKSKPSITGILLLLRGGGMSEDEADALLDKEGIEGALSLAIEALSAAGFLAKMKTATQETAKSSPAAS